MEVEIMLGNCFLFIHLTGTYRIMEFSSVFDEERDILQAEKMRVDTSYRVRGVQFPKYRSAMAQIVMVGLVAFCTV